MDLGWGTSSTTGAGGVSATGSDSASSSKEDARASLIWEEMAWSLLREAMIGEVGGVDWGVLSAGAGAGAGAAAAGVGGTAAAVGVGGTAAAVGVGGTAASAGWTAFSCAAASAAGLARVRLSRFITWAVLLELDSLDADIKNLLTCLEQGAAPYACLGRGKRSPATMLTMS